MKKILSSEIYLEMKTGISMFSMDKVLIIGEQTMELEDGRIVEQFIYNIIGYKAENGKPFVSLKSNIIIE